MVGGRGTDQFNRATMAERQPGSAFKPFVFAAALENKFSPSTVINDSPIKIGDWEPQNDEHTFSGAVTMRQVAQHSMNVPTVKIAQKLGIEKVLYYAQEMGISTLVMDGPHNDKNLASALGGLTKGVTPLELTSAYGTFANKGVHVDPVAAPASAARQPARRARRVTTTTRGSSATRPTSSRASGSATTITPPWAASTAAQCRPPSGRTS